MGAAESPLIVGRYALYDRLASGGMASVHLGRLLGHVGFGRTVAIKRLHPFYAEDPDFVSMFMDEARLAARISHPNVVATLDIVSTLGELFLVMEYVRGESLARLVRASSQRGAPTPFPVLATIMGGVLHGLHAAHEAKNERGEPLDLVHRDVSPQNILVGVDGVSRVLDFGVAKAIGRVQTTRDGQLKGKVAYMAPEQIRGSVSRSTDVYAAAVVLWEGLAGRRLFFAENDGELLDKVLHGCTDPPSKYTPGLPPELDAITMKGLRAAPDERFASAREMARALEAAVAIVAPSQVGEWVESLVAGTLADRDARVAAIESDSADLERRSSGAVPLAAPSKPRGRGARGTPKARSASSLETADTVTSLSSGSVSGSMDPPFGARRSSRAGALLVGGGVALAMCVAAFVAVRPPAPAAPGAQDPASSGGEAAVARPSETTPAGAWTEVIPTPSVSFPSPPSTGEVAPHAPSVPAVSPYVPKHKPGCNPPYVVNDRGMRIFKKECM